MPDEGWFRQLMDFTPEGRGWVANQRRIDDNAALNQVIEGKRPFNRGDFFDPGAAIQGIDQNRQFQAIQQEQAAQPIKQKLADFAASGWSSDPSFSGQEWTQGLMDLSGTKTNPSNPAEAKALSDFANTAQQQKYYADLLQRGGQSVNDAGNLSRFAMNPDTIQHLAALEKAPAAFLGEANTVDPKEIAAQRNSLALQRLPEIMGAKTQDELYANIAKVSKETGADPQFLFNFLKEGGKTFSDKPEANATDEQLIARALEGDKKAKAILDEKDRRLAKRTQTNVTIRNAGRAANININGLSDAENEALSRAIDNGLDPYKVNSRTAKIYARQEMQHPGRRWNELGAQAAFERSATTTNTKALLNTIDPLLDNLEKAGTILGNSSLPGYNRAMNFLKEQTGSADIVGFNNLRDDVVAEVERGLMGSGVLSDSKYNRAIKNINSAQTLPQLKAAIKNTRMVIRARLDAINRGPNPRNQAPVIAPSGGRFKILKVQ